MAINCREVTRQRKGVFGLLWQVNCEKVTGKYMGNTNGREGLRQDSSPSLVMKVFVVFLVQERGEHLPKGICALLVGR